MLKRVYIDNYKCLVNFEYRPGAAQLILGGNGTGKSSVFEVLSLLRSLLDGATTMHLFNNKSRTRWQHKNLQTFELDVEGNGGIYRYQLVIEHKYEADKNRIFKEEVTFDGNSLFTSEKGEAHLYRDDSSKGPDILIDWTRSGLVLLPQRADNQKLMWFKDWVSSSLICIQIDPHRMLSSSEKEQINPEYNLANFASWYHHLLLQRPNVGFQLKKSLQVIIDDFDALSLVKVGDMTRLLQMATRDADGNEVPYEFDELSDGQRALIGLYTLLAVMKEMPITLCIDEPDNFIMLAEIEPWLAEIQEQVDEHGSQVLLISHHPEFINYYVPRDAVRFFRQHGGPVRVAPFDTEGIGMLLPSEIIARGWENE